MTKAEGYNEMNNVTHAVATRWKQTALAGSEATMGVHTAQLS